jgi:hypothetical protein
MASEIWISSIRSKIEIQLLSELVVKQTLQASFFGFLGIFTKKNPLDFNRMGIHWSLNYTTAQPLTCKFNKVELM